jgi:hypothetical protein
MTIVSRQLVLKKLASTFPYPVIARKALQSLDRYGKSPDEPAIDGVHLAIIKLCDGQIGRLRELVREARHDFRDVLFPAQAPEQFRLLSESPPPHWGEISRKKVLTTAKKAAMEKRDHRQWIEWLTS